MSVPAAFGRLGAALLVLTLVATLTFAVFRVLPAGDPARARAGPDAPPELVARVRADLGLDRPLVEQYARWLERAALHGDLGTSYVDGARVVDRLTDAWPATLSVAGGAVLVALALAVPLAVRAAAKPGGVADRIVGPASLLAFVVPGYLLAIAGLYLFSDGIGVVPLAAEPGAYTPLTADPAGWARALLLPWVVLALPLAAVYARLLRARLHDVLTSDHVRAARAAGLPERRIVLRALRAAAPPVVALLGADAGALLGGVVVAEVVFEIPGLGALTLQAVQRSDLPVLEGTVVVAAAAVLLANAAADVLVALADPRQR